MTRRLIPLVVLATLLVNCASALAQPITAFWRPVIITPQAMADDPLLLNMQTWDLMAATTGDWVSAFMRAQLPVGLRFYKHPLGRLTRPDPANFGSSPALEFTTYASSASDNGSNNATSVPSGHPQGHPPSIGDVTGIFSMAWGDLTSDLPGTYHIARLTFPQGALADVIHPTGEFSTTSQVNPDSTTIIPDIPEPGVLGFVATATLFLGRRKPVKADVVRREDESIRASGVIRAVGPHSTPNR